MFVEAFIRLAQDQRLSAEAEKDLLNFYHTLSEKEQRRLAAFEAKRLGYGGQVYIATLLGCSERTIQRGIAELEELDQSDPAANRVRREGAGRPKKRLPARV